MIEVFATGEQILPSTVEKKNKMVKPKVFQPLRFDRHKFKQEKITL